MNIEVTLDGVKTLVNWDNVITAGHVSPKESSFDYEKRVRIWCRGNITWYIDETYEEIKKIIQEAENGN